MEIKLLSTDFSNLRNKTIYDFISDKDVQKITKMPKFILEKHKGDLGNACLFLSLARETQNQSLKKQTMIQFETEIKNAFKD